MHGADGIHARMCYADLSHSDLSALNFYGAQMEGVNPEKRALKEQNWKERM